MSKGLIKIYYGNARGKSPAALGYALAAACEGREVFIVQFLKGRMAGDMGFLKRLEPEIKAFRFDREASYYEDLSPEEKEEEKINILNGLGFVRKVLSIGECDLLILDEILGLVDLGIISSEDVIRLLELRQEETEVVLTGRRLPEELMDYADVIVSLNLVKPSGDA